MADLEKMLKKVHKAIFSNKESVNLEGKEYPIEKTSKKGLRCVYHDDYFFIEQNPDTNSHWADKAQKGDKITWAIKGNDYIANIHNDKYRRFKEK
ncbi:MAG: hypothetical protein GF329_22600 [Candidatus Lokiarchaeota archaeon]|nr:hypothetical protein [Candidatus Lokiarchaeota archaeon]